jgi:membrane associated rhomboid family serine protease
LAAGLLTPESRVDFVDKPHARHGRIGVPRLMDLPMFIPYSVDVPMARMPIANWVLIALTSLISIGILINESQNRHHEDAVNWEEIDKKLEGKNLTPEQEEEFVMNEVRRSLRSGPPLSLQPQKFSILQLVTHVFVHGDIIHLIGNMIFLFVFGNAVNAKMGQGAFLASYFALGALGGIAWLIVGDGRPLVGASGAIMGLVGIFVVLYPRNDVEVLYGLWGPYSGTFSLSAWIVIVVYLGFDLWGTVSEGTRGGVAYIVHLVGGAGGFGLAYGLLSMGYLRPERYEQNLLQVLGVETKKRVDRDAPRKKKVKKTRPEGSVTRNSASGEFRPGKPKPRPPTE